MLRARLGRLDELAVGELRAFAVPGVTWPVLAGVLGGEIVATASVCPHEDVQLAGCDLDGMRLTCPGHGYQFDVLTGRCRHDATLVLHRYPATVIDGDVWIELIG